MTVHTFPCAFPISPSLPPLLLSIILVSQPVVASWVLRLVQVLLALWRVSLQIHSIDKKEQSKLLNLSSEDLERVRYIHVPKILSFNSVVMIQTSWLIPEGLFDHKFASSAASKFIGPDLHTSDDLCYYRDRVNYFKVMAELIFLTINQKSQNVSIKKQFKNESLVIFVTNPLFVLRLVLTNFSILNIRNGT